MLTIGLDIDGTLADSWGTFVKLAKEKYNITCEKSKITKYNVEQNEPFKSLTEKQIVELFTLIWDDYKAVKMEDPAIPEIINNLSKFFKIHIVTASKGNADNIKSWLRLHKIKFDYFTQALHSSNKIDAKVDIHIDDYVKVAILCSENGRKAILLSQPWNGEFRASNSDPNIIVADKWKDIEQILLNEYSSVKRL